MRCASQGPDATGSLCGGEVTVFVEVYQPAPVLLIVGGGHIGRPLAEIFDWFEPTPLGSASLAQAHLARLVSAQEVVLKVLRPGIDVLVETDLTAIALAARWLKLYKRISTRVNLDWLAQEFATITR